MLLDAAFKPSPPYRPSEFLLGRNPCPPVILDAVEKGFFVVALIVVATGFLSPALALATGVVYAFVFPHPYAAEARRFSKLLLQAAVVAFGFGMNLGQVLRTGRSGFVYTALGISAALVLGWALGRIIRVGSVSAFLITVGTAICGGSAIAAVGPLANATDEEMATSLGTVFVLNGIALLLFPLIGWGLRMSETQFGLWAALAIHDTSSVVGATAKYGSVALAVGTTVKLARALWIVPVSLLTAMFMKSKVRTEWPWFILYFCLAALANTYLPVFGPEYAVIRKLGSVALAVTLFLIGTGISKEALRQVGWRTLVLGVSLWAVVACGSLMLIHMGWIAL